MCGHGTARTGRRGENGKNSAEQTCWCTVWEAGPWRTQRISGHKHGQTSMGFCSTPITLAQLTVKNTGRPCIKSSGSVRSSSSVTRLGGVSLKWGTITTFNTPTSRPCLKSTIGVLQRVQVNPCGTNEHRDWWGETRVIFTSERSQT
jgi:hypothetical protein